MLLGLLPATLAAQQGTTVTGVVTAGDGATPIAGAAVDIPELQVGGYTDQSGTYSIITPPSATGRTVVLHARRIGYRLDSAMVTLSGGTVTRNIELDIAVTQLTGVVVTALGIERERSTLGTSQQQISTEDLNATKALNLVQQVQGKVSGVRITGGGTPGGSVNVAIRGQNTFASNNQPLFIVDGIPVSNANRGGSLGGGASAGYDFGNAIGDLNPEDIETFTILKGPNAAAIYGSRAQNGAVVITTKQGVAGRMRSELTMSYTWDRPGRLPDFQNRYGQGAGGNFRYVNGAGAGVCDNCDQSWGPMLDGRLIDQFTGPQQPWIARPDNVESFFETGTSASATLAVSGGTERANARISVGVDDVDGYVPNNEFRKNTALLSGALQVNSQLDASAVIQYVRNTGTNRPGTGYNNSIMQQFFWFGRQVDIDALRNWQQGGATNNGPADREFNWNYNYHNNPFYIQEANGVEDTRDRIFVQGSATYEVTDWLNASLRSGSDIYRFDIDQEYDAAFLHGGFVDANYEGGFRLVDEYRNENNTELLLTANRSVLPNLMVNAMLGGNLRRERFSTTTTQTSGISVSGIYNVSNAAITPTLSQFESRRDMNSVYGSAAFTLNGYWTVEATGRNDVSSTLPRGENSYFYPSVNTSLVLTDAVQSLNNSFLSFLKLRASWAEVGNDADPFQLATTFAGNPNKFDGLPQFSLGNSLLEPNLKPEITRSTEFGVEVGVLDGRASLDLTLYDKETRNQIYLVPVSPTSGYSQKLLNAGTMANSGFEALVTVTPVQLTNFTWTAQANYSRNKNEVVELASGVERIVIGGGLFGDVRLEATKGQPYGAIWGGGYLRDAQGRIQVEGGYPVLADTFVYHGSIQPDWTGGLSNQLTYRNFSLNVLFDIRQGGHLMSYTNYVGQYSGVLETSLRGREVDWNDPGVVVQGIDVDTGEPNTVTLTAENYHQGLFGNVEPYVYDASYVKLREMRFGFEVPPQWAGRINAESISLALIGRNLALWTDVPNVDPEFAYSSGNFQGIEYALPGNTRSIGLSVRITP